MKYDELVLERGLEAFTMNIVKEDVAFSMDKMDGSLISTVTVGSDGEFFVKSKTSFQSEQAQFAQRLIDADQELNGLLKDFVRLGYTVNMELTSPLNRIVLPYQDSRLTILNIRDHHTGATLYEETHLASNKYRVKYFEGFPYKSIEDYVKEVTQVEGLVCVTKSGQMFKLKTDWYCALHHTKDSITIPRRLYEVCLNQAADDLLAMFHDDPIACKMIVCMQELTNHYYNHLVVTVQKFYNENKELSRKDYAILAQKDSELNKLEAFGLAMNLYVGKTVDFVAFLIKHNETVLKQYQERVGNLMVVEE